MSGYGGRSCATFSLVEPPVLSLPQLIGHNARRIRTERGWTQSQVAAALRRVGIPGQHRRVSQIEGGDLAPTLPNLLRLAAALDMLCEDPITVADLLRTGGLVRLPGVAVETVPGPLLLQVVSGAPAAALLPHLRPEGAGDEDWSENPSDGGGGVSEIAYGRADERVARQLGINRATMQSLCRQLWGRSLEAERDRRATLLAQEYTRQGARAAVTAQLREELQAELERI